MLSMSNNFLNFFSPSHAIYVNFSFHVICAEVALGQVFLLVLLFSPVIIIHHCCILIFAFILRYCHIKDKGAKPGNLQRNAFSDSGERWTVKYFRIDVFLSTGC
jgi:hypothetical protein